MFNNILVPKIQTRMQEGMCAGEKSCSYGINGVIAAEYTGQRQAGVLMNACTGCSFCQVF